jgi:tRNA U34 5-carboxymethylaminomethyl modifying enzyme MnmG/GidA
MALKAKIDVLLTEELEVGNTLTEINEYEVMSIKGESPDKVFELMDSAGNRFEFDEVVLTKGPFYKQITMMGTYSHRCKVCNGDGSRSEPDPIRPYPSIISVRCETCNGTGRVNE